MIVQYMGLKQYNKMLDDFPELYPKEVEYRRKFNAVPQEVWDAYYKESFAIDEFYNQNRPHPNIGIFGMMNSPDKAKEIYDYQDSTYAERIAKKRLVHQKHLGKYNLEFNEI